MKKVNNSHLTAKERSSLSFPSKWLFKNKLLIGKILDFGCGFGKDVELLSQQGFYISGYDKFYFKEYPKEKFDTIICNYVLNVLEPDDQVEVLMSVSELLKPKGKAYFTVRRDLKSEGFRIHKIHQKPTYQCNVKLPFKSIFKNDFCEIYEYQHYNSFKKKDQECPFCNPDLSTQLITETATAYAILDKFPVSNGHCLIIPKRHLGSYFDLTLHEQRACWLIVNRCKEIIQKEFSPDGFNIGVNINECAGQSIFHVHIHLIPRYKGDVENPFGGVRGVIPSRKEY
ncbi:MAG: HIT domain-containing protein [Bacteroidales bacterium]|nr:HIT domain-containing protein [Bacteroidales bacterium]